VVPDILNVNSSFSFRIKQSEKKTSWTASHPRKPESSKAILVSLSFSLESLTSKPNEEVCLDLVAKRTYIFFFFFYNFMQNSSDYSTTLEVFCKDTFGLNFFYLVTQTTGPL
jgi:hypothetical protein